MALQYITFRETDFGAGLDQQSAENRIAEGYSEDLRNADPKPTGYIAKRTGYQGYAGYLPLRVQSLSYNTDAEDNIKLVFNESIEMPFGRSQPLIIQGKTSSDNSLNVGDFPTNAEVINYYAGFTSDLRVDFPVGLNTITYLQEDHNISTEYLIFGAAVSTSETTLSNIQLWPDSVEIDIVSKDIDYGIDNNSGGIVKGFNYAKAKDPVVGDVYHSLGNVIPNGGATVNILGATHNLATTNIIAKVYINTGTKLQLIQPVNVLLNESNGDISIQLGNDTGISYTADVIIFNAPEQNFATGSVAPLSSSQITIPIDVVGGSEFAEIACYLETPPSTILEQIIPDSIVTDVAAGTITVTFTNNQNVGANFEVYWDFIPVATNSITITGSVIGSPFQDDTPQLTVWGLCHEEIYGELDPREGWVNHIDSYRAPSENRVIAGLGGNLYAARLGIEGSNVTDYLMPVMYPRLNHRLDSDVVAGPAFWDTSDTPGRTRGYITGDNGQSNFFTISNIAYNSGTGWVDYTLTVPNLAIIGTLSTIISVTSGLEDQFTAQQCGYSTHNGTFVIKAVDNPAADILVISVLNPALDSSDYDEQDVGGEGGIFTDRITTVGFSSFLAGDIIDSELFAETVAPIVVNSVGNIILLREINERVSMPGGLRVVGTRTSSVLPLRTDLNVASVENIVRGDMLNYSEIDRQLRVKSINPLANVSISITGDGFDTLLTIGSGDTSLYFVGQKILVTGTTSYNGVHTITGLVDGDTFQTDFVGTTAESGIILGRTIEIDEELTWKDTTDSSVTISVDSRWIPIEMPTDSFDATPKTRVYHFDNTSFTNQAFLRSCMVQDNLYLTNGDDEVMKFDGTNIYRAGLFRWQPNLFVKTDIAPAGGKIVVGNPQVNISQNSTVDSNDGGYFFIDESDRGVFREGDQIQNTFDGEIYTVKSIELDTGPVHAHVYVDRKIAAGTTTVDDLIKIASYKYYFRLNAVDRNDNIIVSAVTGSDDFVVELGLDAAVNIRLVGMPTWDIYDYDRLEVEIYRTHKNLDAPFFRVTTIPMNFDNNGGYIDYTDTDSDEDLFDFDDAVSNFKGGELATAIAQPMRAKYCTSAGNRLILGNLTDYPQIDLRLLKKGTTLTQSVFTNAANKYWLFRKDNNDVLTNTDMINRAKYEFVNSTVPGGIAASVLVGGAFEGISFQITAVGVNVNPGDWVYLYHTDASVNTGLEYAGWWMVNERVDANTFKVLFNNASSATTANSINRVLTATVKTDIPVPVGYDGNYGQLNGNQEAPNSSYVFYAIKRLAEAINCSMRKVDKTVAGYEEFTPWMAGNAGNEYGSGQLVIRQPRVFGTNLELELPALSGAFDVYGNNIKRVGSSSIGAISRVFPSRIIASYANYPEVFDNPTATVDTESDSAIDVNSADGQEITAIIPFFGDAAFGAAQKSGIIVVFKTNSIYLVDISAKERGETAVQRLETRGKGCTAPYSVSVTRGGIMFANNTGIYRLNRDLNVDFIGRKYDRKFKTQVEKDLIGLMTGHHDTVANSYKLSYPISGESQNSEVAVYNHTREYEGKGEGSWTTYDNHPATGWANLGSESFFASTLGRVFVIRRNGNVTDYRDDDQAISMEVLTRAVDATDSGRRKVYSQIITHYRLPATSIGTTLKGALDLKTNFQDSDVYEIKAEEGDNLSDTGSQKIVTISSVFDEKMGVYMQLKYENSTIDEPVEITGIDYRVGAKTEAGIREARNTTE